MLIIVSLLVVRTSWVVGERVFLVGRWLIWRLVVGIVMLLRVQGVVLGIVVRGVEGIMLFIFFVMSIGVVYVFYRVLHTPSQ